MIVLTKSTYRIGIEDIDISNYGFGLFLGAGASFEAGYPLMDTLTVSVIENLNERQKDIIQGVLTEDFDGYIDIEHGTPNIEVIADLISARAITLGEIQGSQYVSLLSSIRDSIVDIISSVDHPNLDHHVMMLQALSRIRQQAASPLWIFTTNYDSLIELAAAEVGVPLYDGFLGGGPVRFFHVASLKWSHGSINNRHYFEPRKGLQINLIKLHGSIDWWSTKDDTQRQRVFSTLDETRLRASSTRTIILPQRSKTYETMGFPYDQLWRLASETIGRECKYLTSVGYSFGDEHINQNLFTPSLIDGNLKIFAFLKEETPGLANIARFPAVNYGTASCTRKNGEMNYEPSDFWKFSSFVRYLSNYAGL
ncbi:SIR2 family protein [Alicyclobacillus acidocaldarius]|uniref:Uncharacterized protein n=1 Tax=Alicyclobacillus acidocaldarius subsp. acidocaldarius (strain ATCC 27009 / DSM 446 / BCRC 14685 / JCM 5260 / KCTC 1825 / NBRC 15652 / NCIMB 11725 / NRRL B-14509 / 104-IA) TaxID=521098 RepID=C8WVZ4_ALIAD|nr:SIR2 family protein [Alicyclobacillus acidocaldarius]ACV58266.1 hypothetical protein Aaci_1237 [Alicyclobacillus acidocaldarius subsp. acidocaldarius DSM 446]